MEESWSGWRGDIGFPFIWGFASILYPKQRSSAYCDGRRVDGTNVEKTRIRGAVYFTWRQFEFQLVGWEYDRVRRRSDCSCTDWTLHNHNFICSTNQGMEHARETFCSDYMVPQGHCSSRIG